MLFASSTPRVANEERLHLRGPILPEQNLLEQWFSIFQMLGPLNIVPHGIFVAIS